MTAPMREAVVLGSAHALETSAVAARLGVEPANGLSTSEALRRAL